MKATHVVVLPADGSPTWTIYTKESTRTGYGDDWQSHIAYAAEPTIVIDYSTAEWELAVVESVRGPMLSMTVTEDEGIGSFDYVTPETKARRAERTGATVTYLTADQAAEYPCLRCPKCGQPAFEWYGLRHRGASSVRSDNDNGRACQVA